MTFQLKLRFKIVAPAFLPVGPNLSGVRMKANYVHSPKTTFTDHDANFLTMMKPVRNAD
jgi:hypothetical protein